MNKNAQNNQKLRAQITVGMLVVFVLVLGFSIINNVGATASYFGSRGTIDIGIKVKDQMQVITIYDPDGNVYSQEEISIKETTINLPRTTFDSVEQDGKILYF